MVQRLAKGVLPPNTQIQKDAITAMSKGATVFVNHIADKYRQSLLSIPLLICISMSISNFGLLSFPSAFTRARCPLNLHAFHSYPSAYCIRKTIPDIILQPSPLGFSKCCRRLLYLLHQSQRNYPIHQPQNHLPHRRPGSPGRMRIRRVPTPRRGRVETLQRNRHG